MKHQRIRIGMTIWGGVCINILCLAYAANPHLISLDLKDPGAQKPSPVVVELFTSQSCYSCPPAEKLLARMADDPALVTLEWHVDSWDELVYGSAGKWKDPYSSHQWTQRQREYNRLIRGTAASYTPQAVIQGRTETVGSQKSKIDNLITQAAQQKNTGKINFHQTTDTLTVHVKNVPSESVVSVVYFLDTQVTQVPRGENKGKTLASRHVVQSLKTLGNPIGQAVTINRPGTGEGCAILVHEPRQRSILTGAYCPKR